MHCSLLHVLHEVDGNTFLGVPSIRVITRMPVGSDGRCFGGGWVPVTIKSQWVPFVVMWAGCSGLHVGYVGWIAVRGVGCQWCWSDGVISV